MSPLRILHLEDNPTDGELIRSVLEAAGLACTFERVETAADFQAALERKRFDLIVVLDSGGRRLYSSRSYLRLLGDPDASAATDFFAEIHPADRERLEHVFRKTVAEGSGLRAEYRILIKDGSIRYIESQSSVVRAA